MIYLFAKLQKLADIHNLIIPIINYALIKYNFFLIWSPILMILPTLFLPLHSHQIQLIVPLLTKSAN